MNVADLKWIQGKRLDLFVESFSNSTRTIEIRGITKEEQIIGNHITNANRSLATTVIRITELPVFLTARTTETGVSRGECYVKVSIRVDQTVVALLFSGYITDAGAPIFPNGNTESSIVGAGFVNRISGTAPGAGNEISETVPVGTRWKLLAVLLNLATDANAADRGVLLNLGTGGANFHRTRQPDVQAANLSRTYNYALGTFFLPTVNFTEYHNILPDIILPALSTIVTITGSIQAGDIYSTPSFLVEEWIEP